MENLLTPAELAAILGLSPQTIYNRRCAGVSLPPCISIGRVIRFPESGIWPWLHSQSEQPPLKPTEPTRRRPGRPTKAEQVARRRGGAK